MRDRRLKKAGKGSVRADVSKLICLLTTTTELNSYHNSFYVQGHMVLLQMR